VSTVPADAPALEAIGLAKAFGALVVARDVSLVVAPGARHAIVGPNGAGKTTLFNLLTGTLAADAGTVRLAGVDITRLGPDGRARAGLARSFQRSSLFAGMRVGEALATAAALGRGRPVSLWRRFDRLMAPWATARAVAGAIGIADLFEDGVDGLSYGAARQVEIGLALATEPRVLLLDEPTAGMSPEETAAMVAFLKALPRALTLVVVEHDMDVVFGLAERVTVLDYGQVLFEGTPAEMRGSAAVQRRYLGERAP